VTTMSSRIRRAAPVRVRLVKALVAALVIAAVVGLPTGRAPTAFAHSGNESYLYLDVTDEAIGGHVEVPLLLAQEVLDRPLLVGDDREAAALADAGPALRDYVADHLRFVAPSGRALAISFTTLERSDQDLPYASLAFRVDLDGAEVPRILDITFDPFVVELPDRTALLVVRNDIEAGVVGNVDDALVRFDATASTQRVRLDDASWARNLWASIRLGVDHIRTGPDHVLFVLVLLLPSVLVRRSDRWIPASSFGVALRRVLGIATMFTIAHTITFSLAGLGVLPLPPSKLTEAVIAASITVAAFHNLRPLLHGRERVVAFGFGLFHGMGFAALVDDIQTGRSTQLVSLLGRNLGIEVGQATIIVLVFPALYLLRSTASYDAVLRWASLAFATVSIGWLVERLSEHDLGVNGAVEPLLRPSNAALTAASLLAIAGAWRWREGRRGRLVAG